VSTVRSAQISRRPAQARPRPATRARNQRDSHQLVVTILTFLATGIACYDLVLLALAAQ
jgi:hypothetical protein